MLGTIYGSLERLASPVVGLAMRAFAGMRGPDVDANRDLESYRLLVASLFSSPASILISNVVGIFVPFFCWSSTGLDIFFYTGSFAAFIVALRTLTIFRYRRANHAADSWADVAAWDREYFFGATTYSCTLGFNCFYALAFTENVPAHIITIVSAIAYSSGYVARNAGRPTFVIFQLLSFCLPMAAGLFIAADTHYQIIGAFILLYIITNIAITFSINRNLLALAAAHKRTRALAETLRHKNITLDSALNSMTRGLAMFDADLRLEICNSNFMDLYALPKDVAGAGTPLEVLASALIESHVLSPASAGDVAALCRRVLDMRQPATLEVMTERGQAFVISVDLTPDSGILMLTEDATARKAIAAQIERMARIDSLTGLANRFTFNEALRKACHAANELEFAVLYIDLDNFKHINDSLGHDSGDRLLAAMAKRLSGFSRQGDLLARLGGDEFVVLHSGPTESALDLAQRIINSMAAPFEIEGSTIYVTTSIGIASAPEHGSDPMDILRASDIALYAAKAAGRNALAKFDPSMAEALVQRREVENDLREACQTGRLFLHYQPIIDLATGRVTSCEALMRWKHPLKGMIPPDVFIPIAEQTGLIAEMGSWVIRQACMDAANWPEQIAVSVNISAFQFKDPKRLIDTVKDALLMSRLEPSRLELEVTESLLIEDRRSTLEAIRSLRRIGVRFSLDDFGAGYSSLAYLARYPFSSVKIDRSFAENVTSDTPSRSIIEAVCQLARRLGLHVVVEGIETEEQRRAVEKLGAEQAQGYLFGRPEAADVLMPRLLRAA
jgi:diguanylate cyclase (GGDEF)-like protein